MANEQKKYTTFLSMVNANKKDGTFIAATVCGLIGRFKTQTVNGKKLIRASMPVQNRAKALNYMLGTSFPEGDNDTVWFDVAFWEARADRFEKMLEKLENPDRLRVVLVGSLSSRTYAKNDGSGDGTALTLAVSDWNLIKVPENAEKGTAPASDAAPSGNNTNAANSVTPAANDDANTDFDDDGFFSDMDINLDDVPF